MVTEIEFYQNIAADNGVTDVYNKNKHELMREICIAKGLSSAEAYAKNWKELLWWWAAHRAD